MKDLLKNLLLIILIITVCCGIGFMLFRAIKSVNYNKNSKNPVVTLDVKDYGEIQIELEPDYAPNTVATIIKLVQNGYYNGKVFYGTDSKVVSAGMEIKTETKKSDQYDEEGNYIGPEGEETITTQKIDEDSLRVSDLDKNVTPANIDEDSMEEDVNDYKISINGEFVANGFSDNTIRFEKGTVGLYRNNYNGENLSKESFNSGTSLFFITTDEDSTLNGEYAAFGKVIKGMDLIEKMLTVELEKKETDEEGNTTSDNTAGSVNEEIVKYTVESAPVITKATVETYEIDYGMPEFEKAFDYNKYMSDLIMQYYQNQQ